MLSCGEKQCSELSGKIPITNQFEKGILDVDSLFGRLLVLLLPSGIFSHHYQALYLAMRAVQGVQDIVNC